jgi:hypothetical protein
VSEEELLTRICGCRRGRLKEAGEKRVVKKFMS